MCEGKEVTKISLVPLDSCAYTSEELIIPSAKYEIVIPWVVRLYVEIIHEL